ncbi:MAG TPA: type II toxin-antitoxin system RelE/ParE family toxin [Kofleriaceae bacterium]|nr:type II toxin-antitoxin system RelE/ParE family toxin [Kofleriaceae bacterium]
MTSVAATDEFTDWLTTLPNAQQRAVARYVGLLQQFGVTLGHPYSSALKGSRLPLRELRVRHTSSAIRVLYLFDPERSAILLIGGDKSNDKRFYERLIAKAEDIYQRHLAVTEE